jgi:putative ABC transport system permease protein
MISIVIAMMGLFGLASFAAFKRTKEIGIRKVFGASTLSILRLLSGDFAFLVLISFLISLPFSYLFMNQWLSEFAYQVEINPILVILAGLSVLILALLTVGYHAIRASNADPVKTLRYE